jgi:gamma-glutamylputrescine oxidase
LVVVCIDRFMPRMGLQEDNTYHAQTFIALSEPLDDEQLRRIFPEKPLLAWDTDTVYQYFRITGENRLLIGGGMLLESLKERETHEDHVARMLAGYVRERFKQLGDVSFTTWWPGLIGITKDLLPMAGRASDGLYYAGCGAGLPWSVVAGETAVQSALDGSSQLDRFLSPTRAYSPLEPLQPLLRKKATFGLSTTWAKSHQQGDALAVARQQRIVRGALWGAAALGALALARATLKRNTR